jgi:hypothetical protein
MPPKNHVFRSLLFLAFTSPPSGLLGKLGKAGTNLLPRRAHMPPREHRTVFAAPIRRQLPLVLVDTDSW